MKAATVCVNYSDFLQLTIPYNHHHFDRWLIVTSHEDERTIGTVGRLTAELGLEGKLCLYLTDLFYRDGAHFNKWRALEAGLDYLGRDGWITLIDADTVWPRSADLSGIVPGNLYGAIRRMLPASETIPPETDWKKYRTHRNVGEIAGYTQIFHGSDPVLPTPPWHEIDWSHAGGADSFFQARWDRSRKLRLPFEVAHLGDAGTHWAGRVGNYSDGTPIAARGAERATMRRIFADRRRRKNFDGEKIKIPSPDEIREGTEENGGNSEEI